MTFSGIVLAVGLVLFACAFMMRTKVQRTMSLGGAFAIFIAWSHIWSSALALYTFVVAALAFAVIEAKSYVRRESRT